MIEKTRRNTEGLAPKDENPAAFDFQVLPLINLQTAIESPSRSLATLRDTPSWTMLSGELAVHEPKAELP